MTPAEELALRARCDRLRRERDRLAVVLWLRHGPPMLAAEVVHVLMHETRVPTPGLSDALAEHDRAAERGV